jgi:hypothetical protein
VPNLLFVGGPLEGRRVAVTAEVRIGRADADLVVEDGEVSRSHAAVRPVADGVEVEDLGSTNGTWINEARVDGRRVAAVGDVLRIGASTIRIEADHPTPASTSADLHRRDSPVPAPPPAAPTVARPPAMVPDFAGRPSGRRVATRQPIGTFLAIAVIVAVAIALVAFFALR